MLSEGALRQSSLLCLFCSKIFLFNCAFQLCKCFIGSSLLKAAQWLEIHILVVERSILLPGTLSCCHPGAGASTEAPCTRGLRNAFTFSQYYSLKIKIKNYFVLGFVTILALSVLNTSGNVGMDCWDPETHFWLNSPQVSFIHLQVTGALHTYPAFVELPWFPAGLGAAPSDTACPLPAFHFASVQRKLPEP